jgi:hypothetical protein
MSGFDFSAAVSAEAEAYHPSTTEILPKGNYVVKIIEIDNATSSGGYPMIKLTLENELGRQWDNIVISPNEFSVAKLMGLVDACGMKRPNPANGEIDTDNGRLSDVFVYAMLNRTVGIVVRDEEDNREDHQGEFRPRIKGYIAPSVLTSATTGPIAGQTAPSPRAANGQASRDKLAF